MIFRVRREVFSVDSAYLKRREKGEEAAAAEEEEEVEEAEEQEEGCSKREVAAIPRLSLPSLLHPRPPLGLLLFSYGGYVEKDWPPNARTANPVSC